MGLGLGLLHGARLGLRAGARGAQLLELLRGLVRAREQLGELLVAEHLALRLLRRHAPALRLAAALHRAARVDDDAVRRDDPVALAAVEGDLARLLLVAAHEGVLRRQVEGDAVRVRVRARVRVRVGVKVKLRVRGRDRVRVRVRVG